jgi:hypothetical protein
MTALITIPTVMLTVYVIALRVVSKTPYPSLSSTYYILEEKRKNLGVLFTVLLWAIAITVMCAALQASDGRWYQPFAFFTAAALAFVGAAPRYLQQDSKVHYVSAAASAVCSLLWVMATGEWLPLAVFLLAGVAMIWVDKKRNYDTAVFWLEMVCFYAMFAAVRLKLGA